METAGHHSSGSAGPRVAGNAQGVALMLAAVMPVMAIVSLVPVLPLLMGKFAGVPGGTLLVPMAMTIPALCVALFSPAAGWLSDRVGRKWLLVGALLVYAVVGVVPFFLDDLLHIIYARVGLGIAEAVIMTLSTTLIGDYYEGARRERWIAGQVAVASISAIVLSAIGGALGQAFGVQGPFLLYLLAVPVALLAAIVLFEPAAAGRDRPAPTRTLPLGAVLPILLVTLVCGIFFYTTIVKLGPILLLTGASSPAVIGLVAAAANTGVIVGALAFNRLTGASAPALLCIGLTVVAGGYVGMGLSGDFLATSAFAVTAMIGAGLLLPTLLTTVLQVLPEPVRGRGTGLWTGAFFLGQFVAPILASAVEAPAGGLANVLLIWAAIAAAGAAIAALRIRGATPLRQPTQGIGTTAGSTER